MPKRSTNFNGRKNRLTAGGLLGLMDALEIPAEEQRAIAERHAARVAQAARKAIRYDPETRKFGCYLDGERVCLARTYSEGEDTLNELLANLAA